MSDPRAILLLERIAVATEGILAALQAKGGKPKADLANWRPAVAMLVGIWNKHRGPLPEVKKEPSPDSPRYAAAVRCIRVEANMKRWEKAVRAVASSPHHLGNNTTGWRADFDFLLRPAHFERWLTAGDALPDEPEPKAPLALWCEVCGGAEATYGPGTRNADVRAKPTCAGCLEVTA